MENGGKADRADERFPRAGLLKQSRVDREQFSAILSGIPARAREDEKAYRETFHAYRQAMQAYWAGIQAVREREKG